MRIVCSLVIDVLKLSDLISNLWTSDTCNTEISWGLKWRPLLCKTAYFFFLLVYNIYNFFWKPSNWLVVFVVVLLKHPQQAKGWRRVPTFSYTRVLSAPKGHYVELNFSMRSYPWASRPCLRDYYLEIRDGNNQSANVLGVFCGDHKTAVVRSSRRYLWLRFFPYSRYNLNAYYTGSTFNQTGTIFLVNFLLKHEVEIFKFNWNFMI